MLFPAELVNLLILGYDGVCQFFPGVVFGLFWRRVSKIGVFWGIVAGVGVAAVLILSVRDPFLGINAGFVGLLANTGITVMVSLVLQNKSKNMRITV